MSGMQQRAAGGGFSRPVDMSVPPEARGRKRKAKGRGKGASKQMSHGNAPKGVKWRKEWERRDR